MDRSDEHDTATQASFCERFVETVAQCKEGL